MIGSENKNERIMSKYSKYIFLVGLLALMYLVHKYIYLYADDLYYSRDAQAAMNNIPEYAFKELKTNGRVWVHLLLQGLLLDKILYFRIVNPIVITLVAYLMFKVSVGDSINNKKFLIGTGVSSLFFLLLPIEISGTTLYYAACSLNYLYPTAVVILYGYLVVKEHRKISQGYKTNLLLIIIALFAGSSTQQGGMIAIGFTVMASIYYIVFEKKKVSIKIIWYYISLFLAYGTIIFGSILRMKADSGRGSEMRISDTFAQLIKVNIFSKPAFLFVAIISICSIFTVIYYSYKNKGVYVVSKWVKVFDKLISITFALSLIVYAYMIFTRDLSGNLFEIGGKSVVFIIGFTVLYLIMNLYATYLILIKEKKPFYLFCVVNAIGAQIMLIVADPRYAGAYKIMFPSLMLMMIFVIYVVVRFFDNKLFVTLITLTIFISIVPVKNIKLILLILGLIIVLLGILFTLRSRLNNWFKVFIISTCVMLSMANMYKIYSGYKDVGYYQEYNVKAIEEYKENPGMPELILKKVPGSRFGYNLGNWNDMPYFMKQCYGISEDVVIKYID